MSSVSHEDTTSEVFQVTDLLQAGKCNKHFYHKFQFKVIYRVINK